MNLIFSHNLEAFTGEVYGTFLAITDLSILYLCQEFCHFARVILTKLAAVLVPWEILQWDSVLIPIRINQGLSTYCPYWVAEILINWVSVKLWGSLSIFG